MRLEVFNPDNFNSFTAAEMRFSLFRETIIEINQISKLKTLISNSYLIDQTKL